MDTVTSLEEVAELAAARAPLYVRFSAGPQADADEVSRDFESGAELPGLSVNPLNPEQWWTRPVKHWVARQLVQYAHLGESERYAWVLAGREVGRGPDCEPLLAEVQPIARIPDEVVREARQLYEQVFDAGEDGTSDDG